MKYLFILNPISGNKIKGVTLMDLIDDIFQNSDHEIEFACTTAPGDATKIATKARNEHFDVVVAAGGDGTVNEVASGLMGSEVALGIVPLGSGNGIARSYHIPLGLKEAVSYLTKPQITSVDAGRVNDYFFIGTCGVGYDANVGRRFQEFGIRGPLPYYFIGTREFLGFKPETFHLKFNGAEIETRPLLIVVANTEQYGNGAIIAPLADPTDGQLDICIIDSISLKQAMRLTPQLFKGTIHTAPEYHHFRAKTVEIVSSREGGALHTDGEPHERPLKLSISVLPKALKICSPFPASGLHN